ncbi:MAG: hypothetical protein JWO63_1303 [Frankiales bacterium]|nr:hypothetical protein [Frankiales bacterium]
MTTPMNETTMNLRKKFRDDALGDGGVSEYWVPVGFAARLAEVIAPEEIVYWDSDAQNDNGTFRGSFVVITPDLCVSAALVQDAANRFKDDLQSSIVTVRRLADVTAVVLDGADRSWSYDAPLSGRSAVILRFAGDVEIPLTLGRLSNLDLRPVLPDLLAAAGIKKL